MKAFWAAQMVGVIICFMSSKSYFSKRKEKFLMEQLIVNILYALQYFLLDVLVGTVSNTVSLIKYVVFYFNAKNNKKNPGWQVFFFSALSVVACSFTVTGWLDLIPIVSAVIFTYAIWQDDPVRLRVCALIVQFAWIFFNFYARAYVCSVYSLIEFLFTLCSLTILLLRLKKEKNKKKTILVKKKKKLHIRISSKVNETKENIKDKITEMTSQSIDDRFKVKFKIRNKNEDLDKENNVEKIEDKITEMTSKSINDRFKVKFLVGNNDNKRGEK